MEPKEKIVRAKFDCTEVLKTTEGGSVKLHPVVSGSAENEAFYKYTPGGHIQLSTINLDALAQFEPGQSYYVDFTKAPKG